MKLASVANSFITLYPWQGYSVSVSWLVALIKPKSLSSCPVGGWEPVGLPAVGGPLLMPVYITQSRTWCCGQRVKSSYQLRVNSAFSWWRVVYSKCTSGQGEGWECETLWRGWQRQDNGGPETGLKASPMPRQKHKLEFQAVPSTKAR